MGSPINLITDIDFELTSTHVTNGFVKDSLETTIIITPQSVDYPGFSYFTKYSIVTGKGYFVTEDSTVISPDEDVQLLLESEAYTANWRYVGTTPGTHNIKISARDNYSRAKETTLSYEVKPVELLWEVSSPQTMAQVSDTIPLTLQLQNLSEGVDMTFERTISIPEGEGILLDADKKPIAMNTPLEITEGVLPLYYVGTAIGTNTLKFDLQTSTEAKEEATISFDIAAILVNEAPTAVSDVAETFTGIAVAIDALFNDTDPESDGLTITAVAIPNNGTAILEDGQILYTPSTTFVGNEVFEYTITDTAGNESIGSIAVAVTTREVIAVAPRFEAALIVLKHDENPADGFMYKDVAEEITTLDVSGKNIDDLTGMEFFISLEELRAHTNNLTAIDLTNMPKLRIVELYGNEIASIDLTNNPLLTFLDLDSNAVSVLDINNNLELEVLDVKANKIAALDVSTHQKIKKLAIGNRWNGTNFNMINTIAIDHLDLEMLWIDRLPLTQAFDFTKFPNLTFLSCSSIGLGTVDVTQNPLLETLSISANSLLELDLSQNTKLINLYCTDNLISDFDISHITVDQFEILRVNNSPNLSCIQVNDIDAANARTDWRKDADTYYSLDCSIPRPTVPIAASFEAALIALDLEIGPADGVIYQHIAEGFTSLDLSNQGITDLSGIEYFVNLEELVLFFNPIATFNPSRNINLKKLHVGNSDDVGVNNSMITDLDLNSLTNLEDLYLSRVPINSIDLSQNSKLEKLVIANMDLTSLDLSKNIILNDLFCAYNRELKSLDISKNVELVRFNPGGSPVGNLDISHLLKLEFLAMWRTGLTEIDVSKNTNLKSLLVPDNQITAIDVRNNSKLEELRLTDNNVLSLDISALNIDQLLLKTDNNPNLSCVQVNNVDAANARTDWLRDEDTYYSLDCNIPRPTVPIAASFEAALIALDLEIGPADGVIYQHIAEGFTSLDLSDQGITDLSGIEYFVNLEELKLTDNQISEIDIRQLTRLVVFDIGYNLLENIDLSKNMFLEALDVQMNKLSSLNTENNLKLKSLITSSYQYTDFNIIPDLKVNHLVDLEVLRCHGNDLLSIDITKNVKLIEFQCGWNRRLATLDVTKNVALITLNIGITQVESINLSTLKELEFFAAYAANLASIDVKNNLNLKSLLIPRNSISSLDLDNNFLLSDIWISQNELTNLDVSTIAISQLLLKAENNPNLSCIQVNNVDAANARTDWLKDEGTIYSTRCE